jgi:hypothetical protein
LDLRIASASANVQAPIASMRTDATEPQPVGLRIELKHVKPVVWRRIVVSNQWTLASLHNYVPWVVGWQDSHAHEFHIGSRVVAPEWWIREMEFDRETTQSRESRLGGTRRRRR